MADALAAASAPDGVVAEGGTAAQEQQQQQEPRRMSTWELLTQTLLVYFLVGGAASLYGKISGKGGPPSPSSPSVEPLGPIIPEHLLHNQISLSDAYRLTREKQIKAREQHEYMQSLVQKAGISIPQTPMPRVFPTIDADGRLLGPHKQLLEKHAALSLHVYLSDSERFEYTRDKHSLVFNISEFRFDWSYTSTETTSIDIGISEAFLRSNSSLWAHVLVVAAPRPVFAMDPLASADDPTASSSSGSGSGSSSGSGAASAPVDLEALLAEPSSMLILQQQEVTHSSLPPHAPRLFYRAIPLMKFRQVKAPKAVRSLLATTAAVDVSVNVDGTSTAAAAAGTTAATATHTDSNSNTSNSSNSTRPYQTLWTPSLNLSLILDMPAFPRNSLPPPMLKHLRFDPYGAYGPVIYHNEFWQLAKNLPVVNESVLCSDGVGGLGSPSPSPSADAGAWWIARQPPTPSHSSSSASSSSSAAAAAPPPCGQLQLGISYSHLSFFYWQLQTSLEDQWQSQQSTGTGTERESDIMRELLLDTNPFLLALTAVVSLLHSAFDFLAFKNDYSYWKNKKSLAGVSVRSLIINTFFQAVIFLYLMDNDTSVMVLVSSGIGLVLEIWKVSRAVGVSVTWGGAGGLVPTFAFKMADSYSGAAAAAAGAGPGSETAKAGAIADADAPTSPPPSATTTAAAAAAPPSTEFLDREATTHLLYLLAPVMVGYSTYSLLHTQHKSFYSWALGSLVGFVYAFGFVLMTPQLYINYRLRSVAHMPWRAMVYKALNTVIDDLFAFIIKMPWLHRLACFRDDLIFLVYLYQFWSYPVDKARVNEFGQGGGEGEVATELAAAAVAADTAAASGATGATASGAAGAAAAKGEEVAE